MLWSSGGCIRGMSEPCERLDCARWGCDNAAGGAALRGAMQVGELGLGLG